MSMARNVAAFEYGEVPCVIHTRMGPSYTGVIRSHHSQKAVFLRCDDTRSVLIPWGDITAIIAQPREYKTRRNA